jgi:Ca-activated chloride channel family protein
MTWAAPGFAWLLLLLIPFAFLLRRAVALQRRDSRLLAGDAAGPDRLSTRMRLGLARLLLLVAFVLLVVALCRPQWGEVTTSRQGQSIDVLIALDVSRSMLADDLQPSRLARAKVAIAQLLPKLKGDRVGLIAFAGSAFMVCPLTSDYIAVAEVLNEAGPDYQPLGGTALASGLREAERTLASTKSKSLILVSDGEDHAGESLAAAHALRQAGVTLHVVAVGAESGGLIPLAGGAFHKDRKGDIVRSRPDFDLLRSIAKAGGGRLFDLAVTPDAFERIHADDLAKLNQQDIRGVRRQLAERFQAPLAVAILLFFVAPLVVPRRRA